MTEGEQFYEDMAVDVLARTIWGEARGEGKTGMEAVACVVQNRVAVARAHKGRYWWGHDIISVCQKPFQFSCWNANDPQRAKVIAVTDRNVQFAACLRVARRCVLGKIRDITNGATHYHTADVMPHWAEGQKPCAVIGHHIFYKLER
jgi:spore germination cell wall hydrolase CwlJ-like protein